MLPLEDYDSFRNAFIAHYKTSHIFKLLKIKNKVFSFSSWCFQAYIRIFSSSLCTSSRGLLLNWILQWYYNALIWLLKCWNKIFYFPEKSFMYPRCCLGTPRTCFCLGHTVCINVTLIQHTQAVHARDALTVPQQIAAIQPSGKQELLAGLPADFAMIHSYGIHGPVGRLRSQMLLE